MLSSHSFGLTSFCGAASLHLVWNSQPKREGVCFHMSLEMMLQLTQTACKHREFNCAPEDQIVDARNFLNG